MRLSAPPQVAVPWLQSLGPTIVGFEGGGLPGVAQFARREGSTQVSQTHVGVSAIGSKLSPSFSLVWYSPNQWPPSWAAT